MRVLCDYCKHMKIGLSEKEWRVVCGKGHGLFHMVQRSKCQDVELKEEYEIESENEDKRDE